MGEKVQNFVQNDIKDTIDDGISYASIGTLSEYIDVNLDQNIDFTQFPGINITTGDVHSEVMMSQDNHTISVNVHYPVNIEMDGTSYTTSKYYLIYRLINSGRLPVDADGVTTTEMNFVASNDKAVIAVQSGTKAILTNRTPIKDISIQIKDINDKASYPFTIGSIVYDLQPDNALFDPPLVFEIKYNESKLPFGINEQQLKIILILDNGSIVDVNSTVDLDNNLITASVDHFSQYALTAEYPEPVCTDSDVNTSYPDGKNLFKKGTVRIGSDYSIEVTAYNYKSANHLQKAAPLTGTYSGYKDAFDPAIWDLSESYCRSNGSADICSFGLSAAEHPSRFRYYVPPAKCTDRNGLCPVSLALFSPQKSAIGVIVRAGRPPETKVGSVTTTQFMDLPWNNKNNAADPSYTLQQLRDYDGYVRNGGGTIGVLHDFYDTSDGEWIYLEVIKASDDDTGWIAGSSYQLAVEKEEYIDWYNNEAVWDPTGDPLPLVDDFIEYTDVSVNPIQVKEFYCENNEPNSSIFECPAGRMSIDGACSLNCYPNCSGRECGDDNCGFSCGDCSSGKVCIDNKCVVGSCVSNCTERECGDDGCGNSCGNCGQSENCNNGVCIPGSCTPDCNGNECGDNGCGYPCGYCSWPESCTNGNCVCDMTCSDVGYECDFICGQSCGTCGDDVCYYGHCISPAKKDYYDCIKQYNSEISICFLKNLGLSIIGDVQSCIEYKYCPDPDIDNDPCTVFDEVLCDEEQVDAENGDKGSEVDFMISEALSSTSCSEDINYYTDNLDLSTEDIYCFTVKGTKGPILFSVYEGPNVGTSVFDGYNDPDWGPYDPDLGRYIYGPYPCSDGIWTVTACIDTNNDGKWDGVAYSNGIFLGQCDTSDPSYAGTVSLSCTVPQVQYPENFVVDITPNSNLGCDDEMAVTINADYTSKYEYKFGYDNTLQSRAATNRDLQEWGDFSTVGFASQPVTIEGNLGNKGYYQWSFRACNENGCSDPKNAVFNVIDGCD
ncbi:hypothetical protein K9M79_03100 [Candidatus Woesearchaeota archaeon]|nr:hypothetical protein [Candidatus Woesearchaeota archaeon]